MRAIVKTCLLGTGLLILCAGTLMAQEAGKRSSGRGQGQDSNARGDSTRANDAQGSNAREAEGMRAGHDSRILVGHAVSMAIGSVTLKGQAEQAGTPGQSGSQGIRSQAATGQDPAQQLLMHARKGMQESRRLIQGAGQNQGSGQQLYSAANAYINTLFALCGESSSGQNTGSTRTGDATNDTGRARTGRSSRDEDLGAGQAGRQGKTLSARDKAAVALINHSVCEVIEGTHMTHMLNSQAGGSSSATELLRRHAREMTTEGRETLQRYLGSSATGGSGTGNADRGSSGRTSSRDDNERSKAGGDTANAAGGQEGEASVTALARRGQELIEAFQAGGHGGAQGGSERSGGSRRDREGGSSGTERSSETGRSSGAVKETNPR